MGLPAHVAAALGREVRAKRPKHGLVSPCHLALLLCLLLPACQPKPPASTLPPASAPYTRATNFRPAVVHNVPQARTNSRVVVAVRPLGEVPFDGLTLPLTSPDGRFIATQHGATPPWPALLAQSGHDAVVPRSLRLAAYAVDLDPARAASAITEVSWPAPVPRAVLLGRSCDNDGFLIEAPRPDGQSPGGQRWIGRVNWSTGALTWLVSDSRPAPAGADEPASKVFAAFASLGLAGELAYSLRTDSGAFDLVVRTSAADPTTNRTLAATPEESYLCPTFSADRSRVYALAVPTDPRASLAVIAVDLSGKGDLAIASRADLNVAPSIATAYQTVTALQSPWPLPSGADPRFSSGLALVSGQSLAMVWFDAASGSLIPLARGTLGAAPFIAPSSNTGRFDAGLLLGAARELVFQPILGSAAAASNAPLAFGQEVAVITGPYLPRLTTLIQKDGAPIFLLLSPPRAGEVGGVKVLVMSPVQ